MSKIKDYIEEYPFEVITGIKEPINNERMVKHLGFEDVRDYNHFTLNPKNGSSPWDKNPLE